MKPRDKGIIGEEKAAEYLEGKGHKILARNYRTRYGEIDIISEEGSCVVFVEVKMRKDRRYAEAKESVGKRKQGRMVKTAWIWLGEQGRREPITRFDVVEVYMGESRKKVEINHIRDAFESGGYE